MTDSARDNVPVLPASAADLADLTPGRLRFGLPAALTAAVIVLTLALAVAFWNTTPESPLLIESTPGQLALWMAAQSAEAAPEAWLGQFARTWAGWLGQKALPEAAALSAMRVAGIIHILLTAAVASVGVYGSLRRAPWTRPVLLVALLGLDLLVFSIPVLEGDSTSGLLLVTITVLLAALLALDGKVGKVIGFMVALSALLVVWGAAKALGTAVGYQITLPQPTFTYTVYPTLDDALAAVQNGEAAALIADGRDIEALIPEAGAEPAGQTRSDLRLLTGIEAGNHILGLPIEPTLPGRLEVAVRADDADRWASLGDLVGQPLAVVTGSFAQERFIPQPRVLVVVSLAITNNLNLPHLQDIAEALLQPARRNGPVLLLRILSEAALATWAKAALGFLIGAGLGFVLGTLFAHSRLLERGLLPYVVASQTVPILAIAPMVIIWLGANWTSVAVIAAYLTFFPVTINTLRGLQSPQPNALELMRSYAAHPWTIMWKLRFPAALPYIFTALKVSATASVVGAIIGELPSGISDGLGRAILNFNQYYTSDPAKLWAAIFISALVGIVFFVIVSVIERAVLRGKVQSA